MILPLQHAEFNLNVSGIVGFFGGKEAVSAMASVHFYKTRKGLGFYNSPGSYAVGKYYGRLGQSGIWNGLYPGKRTDPATLLGLDGMHGPKYVGLFSGTIINKTSHIGYLLAKHCARLKISEPDVEQNEEKSIMRLKLGEEENREGSIAQLGPEEHEERSTTPIRVTFVNLPGRGPEPIVHPSSPGKSSPLKYSPILAIIPIGASIGACVVCALFQDWYCFSLILLGMVCNGISCYIIGSGKLLFTHPKPSKHSPPGDGLLIADDQIVVLKGSEAAVNSITRGRFKLDYKCKRHHDVGASSVALTFQFLIQLFLVPQGSLLGQIMFLSSLAVSWLYNAYLSSIDREYQQRRMLLDILNLEDMSNRSPPDIERTPRQIRPFLLPSRTSMAVFVLLIIHSQCPSGGSPDYLRAVLDILIPNHTPVWDCWKDIVIQSIGDLLNHSFSILDPYPIIPGFDSNRQKLGNADQNLLRDLLQQAKDASDIFPTRF